VLASELASSRQVTLLDGVVIAGSKRSLQSGSLPYRRHLAGAFDLHGLL